MNAFQGMRRQDKKKDQVNLAFFCQSKSVATDPSSVSLDSGPPHRFACIDYVVAGQNSFGEAPRGGRAHY